MDAFCDDPEFNDACFAFEKQMATNKTKPTWSPDSNTDSDSSESEQHNKPTHESKRARTDAHVDQKPASKAAPHMNDIWFHIKDQQ